MSEQKFRSVGILGAACLCGVVAGLFGVGGGALLIPLLVLLFGFSQHRAQGTTLVAMIPPTSLLALVSYAKAGYVSWRAGLLLIPGILVGGILGGLLAERFDARRMRQVFSGMVFALGAWQAVSAWWR